METGDDYTCLMVEGRPVGGAFPPQMEGIPPHWEVYLNVEDCDASWPGGRARRQRAGAGVRPGRASAGPALVRDPQGALLGAPAEPAGMMRP